MKDDFSQSARMGRLTTALGPDVLVLLRFQGEERLNGLFDFGRPACVELAVLVDRGGRELPVAARYCAHTLPQPLPASQSLQLERSENGALALRLIDA